MTDHADEIHELYIQGEKDLLFTLSPSYTTDFLIYSERIKIYALYDSRV